jgi:hypothetical protein
LLYLLSSSFGGLPGSSSLNFFFTDGALLEEAAAPLLEEAAAPLLEEAAAPLLEEAAAPLVNALSREARPCSSFFQKG